MTNPKKEENPIVTKRGEMHDHTWTSLTPEMKSVGNLMQRMYVRKCQLCGETESTENPPEKKKH